MPSSLTIQPGKGVEVDRPVKRVVCHVGSVRVTEQGKPAYVLLAGETVDVDPVRALDLNSVAGGAKVGVFFAEDELPATEAPKPKTKPKVKRRAKKAASKPKAKAKTKKKGK